MEDLTHLHPGAQRGIVPEGVDPQSWMGFEQQIRERRVRALLDTVRAGLAGGDLLVAYAALEEARALRPDAPEILEFEKLLQAPSAHPFAARRLPWSRAAGALFMLAVGVGMNMGVELLRPAARSTIMPTSTLPAPAPPPIVEPSPPLELDEPASPELSQPMPVLVTAVEGAPGFATPPVSAPRTTSTRSSPVRVRPERRPAERRAPEVSAPVRRAPVVDRSTMQTEAARSQISSPAAPPVPSEPSPAYIESRAPSTPEPVSTPPSAPSATAADESLVAEVLRRYARAYRELNARAARDVWPSVDERALARAFENLVSQNLSFENCQIDVHGETANASCRGRASYVGKVGGDTPRIEPRAWQFELQRDGDNWKIKNAEARRLTSSSQ